MFKVAETATEEEIKRMCQYAYPNMGKKMGKIYKKEKARRVSSHRLLSLEQP